MSASRIEELLRDAYGPHSECPPPEAYLEASMEELGAEETRRIMAHAENCPACAAERDLAQEYDRAEEMVATSGDVAFITSRLERTDETEPVVPIAAASERPAGIGRRYGLSGLAAAAMLVVAVTGAVVIQRSTPPPLPPLEPGGQTRGSRLEIAFPVGPQKTAPRSARWEEIEGAASYQLTLTRVDDSVLFETTVTPASMELPEHVVNALDPAVVYFLTVEARNVEGSRVGISERVRFWVEPVPEAPAATSGGH